MTAIRGQRLEVRGLRSVVIKAAPLSSWRFAVCCFGALLFALCSSASAQQTSVTIPRIGYLASSSSTASSYSRTAFQQGLRDLAYVEGKNILVDYRFAEGRVERYPELARELVNLNIRVLVVSGGTNATLRVKDVANAVPIVFPLASDPVRDKLVASLARPGGNLTGLTSFSRDLLGKRLELLKEVVPKLSRVGVFMDPNDPGNLASFSYMEADSKALGIVVQALEARSPQEFDNAFRLATAAKAAAVLILPTSLLNAHRKRIAQIAINNRLPTMVATSQFMDAGSLMSYGPDYADLHRRAATYVDKILKGAKAADLPVEQPSKFELVINLKTAKQLGITIPPNVLARADRVIK